MDQASGFAVKTWVRVFFHGRDLSEAHGSALLYSINHPSTHFYDTFNLGSGQGNTVLELVKIFEMISGQSLPYSIGPRREGDVAAVWADVQKSRDLLAWQTRRSLQEALEDAWRWQQRLGG